MATRTEELSRIQQSLGAIAFFFVLNFIKFHILHQHIEGRKEADGVAVKTVPPALLENVTPKKGKQRPQE